MDEQEIELNEPLDLSPAEEPDIPRLRSILATRSSRSHVRNAKADRNGRTLRRDLLRQGVRLS